MSMGNAKRIFCNKIKVASMLFYKKNELLAFLSIVAFTPSIFANNSSSISLEEVIKIFRKSAFIEQTTKNLEEKKVNQFKSEQLRLHEPPRIEMKSSLSQGSGKSTFNQEAILKKKWITGFDESELNLRFEKEKESEIQERSWNYRELELDLAKTYVKAILSKNLREEAFSFKTTLEALSSKTTKAASLGTLNGLTAMRSKLLLEEIKADEKKYQSSFYLSLNSLSQSLGDDLSTVKDLRPIEESESDYQFDEKSFLPAKVIRAKQESITLESSQIRRMREYDTGFGIAHDTETNKKEIFIQIEIPLGVGDLKNAEAAVLSSQKELLNSDLDFVITKGKQEFQSLNQKIKTKKSQLETMKEKSSAIEKLRNTSKKAFAEGQGEVSELLEAEKELYSSRVEILETKAELSENILEMKAFLKGGFL